ncbi:MAG: tetratricopeptide repeat protein [Pirellulaceae bacterium]|nr:tetratricopeptide repeat protein [Pirellulaceae bacterium]
MNKKKRELEQNELADALGSKIEELTPYLPKFALFSGLAILLIIAGAFWYNTREKVSSEQWREYFVSSRFTDSRGMKTVAEFFPNTTVGTLALISAADADYANGSRNIISNRENYTNQLKAAISNYELALENSNADKFERARATYALGYSLEAMGRFDDARKMYTEVVEQLPDTPESELSGKALKRVDNPQITSIYAAFDAWAPADESAPGESGSLLPVRPDITLPATGTDEPAGEAKSTPEDAKPSDEDAKPSDEDASGSDADASGAEKSEAGSESKTEGEGEPKKADGN